MPNLFTTGAVDNIDHNPSSATEKSSFHGTAISLMQHATDANEVNKENVTLFGTENQGQGSRKIPQLPPSYGIVHPAALHNRNPVVPPVNGPVRPDIEASLSVIDGEQEWLNYIAETLQK